MVRPTPDFNTVKLKWAGVLLDGSPAKGTLELTYNGPIMRDDDAVNPLNIFPVKLTQVIGSLPITSGGTTYTVGYAEWDVPASNDPDIEGSGGTYRLVESLTGGGAGRSFDFVADVNATNGVIWLNKVAPSAPASGVPVSAVYLADFNALASRVSAVELAGGGGGAVAYTDEQVRDVIGAALIAGTNITKVVNDAGDTITLSATVPTAGTGASNYAAGNDTRLSDTRTPTDGSVTNAKVASGAAIAPSKLGTGTPATGRYLDGGSGAWTALPVGVTSPTITTIVQITQSAYTALATKDAGTLYVVVG
jgi:hypothetical protein